MRESGSTHAVWVCLVRLCPYASTGDEIVQKISEARAEVVAVEEEENEEEEKDEEKEATTTAAAAAATALPPQATPPPPEKEEKEGEEKEGEKEKEEKVELTEDEAARRIQNSLFRNRKARALIKALKLRQ